MLRNEVQFGDHMTVCIALGVLHTTVWVMWLLWLRFFCSTGHTAVTNGGNNMERKNEDGDDVQGAELKDNKTQIALLIMPPHKWLCLLCQVYFSVAAVGLEMLDFPPQMGHFDAHSLWHAATIPLGFIWYYFWEKEIIEG